MHLLYPSPGNTSPFMQISDINRWTYDALYYYIYPYRHARRDAGRFPCRRCEGITVLWQPAWYVISWPCPLHRTSHGRCFSHSCKHRSFIWSFFVSQSFWIHSRVFFSLIPLIVDIYWIFVLSFHLKATIQKPLELFLYIGTLLMALFSLWRATTWWWLNGQSTLIAKFVPIHIFHHCSIITEYGSLFKTRYTTFHIASYVYDLKDSGYIFCVKICLWIHIIGVDTLPLHVVNFHSMWLHCGILRKTWNKTID